MPRPHTRPAARLAGLGIGIGLVVAVTLPPFVPASTRSLLMAAFSGVCHQLPDRSPHVAGIAFAVCFRCYGIYWGLPIAALLFPAIDRRLRRFDRLAPFVLGASLLPVGVDWTLEAFGLVAGSQTVRLVTGLVFGLAAGYYLVSAIAGSRGSLREDPA